MVPLATFHDHVENVKFGDFGEGTYQGPWLSPCTWKPWQSLAPLEKSQSRLGLVRNRNGQKVSCSVSLPAKTLVGRSSPSFPACELQPSIPAGWTLGTRGEIAASVLTRSSWDLGPWALSQHHSALYAWGTLGPGEKQPDLGRRAYPPETLRLGQDKPAKRELANLWALLTDWVRSRCGHMVPDTGKEEPASAGCLSSSVNQEGQ